MYMKLAYDFRCVRNCHRRCFPMVSGYGKRM